MQGEKDSVQRAMEPDIGLETRLRFKVACYEATRPLPTMSLAMACCAVAWLSHVALPDNWGRRLAVN